ncbi:hypothetical protein D3C85_1760880 [compost metagenome]
MARNTLAYTVVFAAITPRLVCRAWVVIRGNADNLPMGISRMSSSINCGARSGFSRTCCQSDGAHSKV